MAALWWISEVNPSSYVQTSTTDPQHKLYYQRTPPSTAVVSLINNKVHQVFTFLCYFFMMMLCWSLNSTNYPCTASLLPWLRGWHALRMPSISNFCHAPCHPLATGRHGNTENNPPLTGLKTQGDYKQLFACQLPHPHPHPQRSSQLSPANITSH